MITASRLRAASGLFKEWTKGDKSRKRGRREVNGDGGGWEADEVKSLVMQPT